MGEDASDVEIMQMSHTALAMINVEPDFLWVISFDIILHNSTALHHLSLSCVLFVIEKVLYILSEVQDDPMQSDMRELLKRHTRSMTLFPYGDLSLTHTHLHTHPSSRDIYMRNMLWHNTLRIETYSISHEVEGKLTLGMANVPSLIGSPEGLSSEHRKQPRPFISASVIRAQHAAITSSPYASLDPHESARQPVTIKTQCQNWREEKFH